MKQRVTKEQVLSLSKEQKEKLRELWQPKKYEPYIYKEKYEGIFEQLNFNKANMLPLLSIGQIWEILLNNKVDIGAYISLESDGLCDSLFEALKEEVL